MMEIPRFLWTRDRRRVYHAIRELAQGSIQCVTLYGASGTGKSELLKRILADISWDLPFGSYLKRIRRADADRGYIPRRVLALAEELGIVDAENREPAATFIGGHHAWMDAREIDGSAARVHIERLARRLGRPSPDPLRVLKALGIIDNVTGRYPLLLTAEVMDRPKDLDIKILDAAEHSPEQTTRYGRHRAVCDLLEALPCVLLVDEADLLAPDSLHAIRGLSDITGTPICLAGTKNLEARLLREPRLRPLATRVATRLELAPLTLADLQGALPKLDGPIVIALWKAGAGEFRTITLVLAALRRLQQENPGRKLTRKAVAMAAAQVLAARPISRGTEEDDLESVDATETDVGRQQMRPDEIPIPSRQVARAAG